MLDSHVNFYAAAGKRQILIVDDEAVNRLLLGSVLEEKYEILYAQTGQEAISLVDLHHNTLCLVLLDLILPDIHGFDVLRYIRENHGSEKLPVIVMTSDRSAEVESLTLGAIDFIPKPYPLPEVIQARVQRTIELSEDRDIIHQTERDPLTGLYNKEFFFRNAEQFDQFHQDLSMDAIIVDINHIHMINERYGRAYGDEVLGRIGQKLRSIVQGSGGIVCRREADTFLIYCPHREDHQELLESASAGLTGSDEGDNRIRLRMGIYSDVDKSLDIERRFDRAKNAADSVRSSFTRVIGYYDRDLHEKEIYKEQLLEDFHKAIEERQFVVYYQPKYDVRPQRPILIGAEALVRWNHPELGMISPGIFIPLFEGNGLIQVLDSYVWRAAAAQIKAWKEETGLTIPVSVNVSRIDMYEPNLLGNFLDLMTEFGLSPQEFHLEITESAYTNDSAQIIGKVEELRRAGFCIEMDDFGTGYSSLSMISNLPIDVLKLDMQFIRNAFSGSRDMRMVEVIIEIADSLSVPIVAEGVETEEQMHALKAMGCDIVQGYFFSKPVSAKEFTAFLQEKIKQLEEIAEKERQEQAAREAEAAAAAEQIRSEAAEEPVQTVRSLRGIRMRTATFAFVLMAFAVSLALLVSDSLVNRGYRRMDTASREYIAAQQAAANMEIGSDYLTDRVRCFAETGELRYLEDFFEELEVTKRRDRALTELETLMKGNGGNAYGYLAEALRLSNTLVEQEYLSMRLMIEAMGYDLDEMPAALQEIGIGEEYRDLSGEELSAEARELVFNERYLDYKEKIKKNVEKSTQELIEASATELDGSSARMFGVLTLQTILNLCLMLSIVVFVIFISTQVRKPLTKMVDRIRSGKDIPPKGAAELRFVAETYNEMFAENQKAHQQLTYDASHDALTGLYNRSAYEMLLQSSDQRHIALLIVDIDRFKNVNDQYGHDMGDRLLKRVADILRSSFRSVDHICRIGGDEFAVIMTRVDSSHRRLVLNKVEQANVQLQHPQDDLPPVSLSVGVAFADRKNPQGDIFKDADTALYRVKEAGRCGCSIY